MTTTAVRLLKAQRLLSQAQSLDAADAVLADADRFVAFCQRQVDAADGTSLAAD